MCTHHGFVSWVRILGSYLVLVSWIRIMGSYCNQILYYGFVFRVYCPNAVHHFASVASGSNSSLFCFLCCIRSIRSAWRARISHHQAVLQNLQAVLQNLLMNSNKKSAKRMTVTCTQNKNSKSIMGQGAGNIGTQLMSQAVLVNLQPHGTTR